MISGFPKTWNGVTISGIARKATWEVDTKANTKTWHLDDSYRGKIVHVETTYNMNSPITADFIANYKLLCSALQEASDAYNTHFQKLSDELDYTMPVVQRFVSRYEEATKVIKSRETQTKFAMSTALYDYGKSLGSFMSNGIRLTFAVGDTYLSRDRMNLNLCETTWRGKLVHIEKGGNFSPALADYIVQDYEKIKTALSGLAEQYKKHVAETDIFKDLTII